MQLRRSGAVMGPRWAHPAPLIHRRRRTFCSGQSATGAHTVHDGRLGPHDSTRRASLSRLGGGSMLPQTGESSR